MIQLCIFLTDLLLVILTFVASFIIRYGWNIPEFSFAPYKDNFPFLTFIYMLSLVFARVFKCRFRTHWELFSRVSYGMFLGTMFGFMFVYVFRIKWQAFPSSVFAISFIVGIILIYGVNATVLRLAGKIKKKVFIVGEENSLSFFNNDLLVDKTYVNSIEEIAQHKDTDEIVICKQIHEDKQLNLLIYLLLKLKVNVVFSPSVYAELLSGSMMEENSIQFLRTFIGRKSDSEEFLIRAFDVAVSVMMLILLSPLLGLVCVLIKLTSAGPVFYKQDRIAKDGKIFTLYKFRTMVVGAEEETGPVLASENDSRVTRTGRFMRNTRIDELPQLFNVIRGDMSLVGPRPERPHFVKRHRTLREVRLAVKPGLTGFAQIRSVYDLQPKHKIKYDYLYIQRRSFLLNLYILAKTIPVIFSKKGW